MNIYIIGASKGIGAGIAEAFAKRKHNLFLSSRDIEGLRSVSEKLANKYGIDCKYNFIDVINKQSIIASFRECIDKFGIPDVIIYNSGISKTDDFKDFQSQIIKDIFNVNFNGLLDTMEVVLPDLLKSGKNAIFAGTTSLAEFKGIPGNAGYSASKIAASHVLEAARCQLLSTNVKITTIKPGFVYTNMTGNNKFPMPFVITAEKAGEYIATGILKKKSIVAFPKIVQFLSWQAKALPSFVYDNVMKHWKKKKFIENY